MSDYWVIAVLLALLLAFVIAAFAAAVKAGEADDSDG